MVLYSDNLEKYAQYLDDESSIAKGTTATRIWFPTSHDEVMEIVRKAIQENIPLTISGGGTGISGGRAPLHGWIVATDKMTSISDPAARKWKDPETGIEYGIKFFQENGKEYITVPVGMSLKAVLTCCREENLLYPPDPTERSSYIGGNMATNASGARSFKFGATRNWIQAARIILANGKSLWLDRNLKHDTQDVLSFSVGDEIFNVSIPDLKLPNVTKHVAGPVLTKDSHPLDIFIGTNGIFGISTEITLRLLPLPTKIISMFAYCSSPEQSYELIQKCQKHREENAYPQPMSVELLDASAIKVMQQKDGRVGVSGAEAAILLEQDIYTEDEEDDVLMAWHEIFDQIGIIEVSVALTHSENEHHKFLRHWVPEFLISNAKKYGYPLVVSDTSVPSSKFIDFMGFLNRIEEEFLEESKDELSTILLGHVGDNHPHLALIPVNDRQAELSQKLLLDIIDKTVEFGGSIASEHGLGKKTFGNKPAIMKQYGQNGVEVIREMKSILDPNYLLCPGNIVPVLHQ